MSHRVFDELNAMRGRLTGSRCLPVHATQRLDLCVNWIPRSLPSVGWIFRSSISSYARDGHLRPTEQTLNYLRTQNFKVIAHRVVNSIAECNDVEIVALNESREKFPFDMDGAVVKVNSLTDRKLLGQYRQISPVGHCI